MKTIGVVGAGAWGTALAQALTNGGRNVTLWAREEEVATDINTKHENTTFLPGVPLHHDLIATTLIEDIIDNDILLLVTPAQFLRASLETLKYHLRKGQPIVICSKGIELGTGLLLSQVAKEVLGEQPVAILTGPTFASEIARGLPSAVTIACTDRETAKMLQENIGVPGFRPYITDDIIGTQLGGAIKNVIAIACGIITGKKLGDSARAALITRGLAEIARLGTALDAQKETLLGMCGVGDLMLTCSSMQSRNFSLGVALGKGKTLKEILGDRISVTEGVHTAKSALELAKKNAVEMPIVEAVNDCLSNDLSIDEAIEDMLKRPFRYQGF